MDFSTELETAETTQEVSDTMVTFFCKILQTICCDEVLDVTDDEEQPPWSDNNFLMSEDGKSFSGLAYTRTEVFPFTITEDKTGIWSGSIPCHLMV